MLYTRFSTMMFLQFAVWGSWAVPIAGHMNHLGFSGQEISYVFGTTAFGSLISPLIAGWVVDCFVSNQNFTALCHFVGAPLLYLAWQQTVFLPLWLAIFFYAMLYMPTIALTNAIAFHHSDDSIIFGNVCARGTLGWIATAWVLSLYLGYREHVDPVGVYLGDCLLFAAGLSILMGAYCLTLPDTPPSPTKDHPYAFIDAFRLTHNRNFGVLLVVSFVVAIELPFYYNLTFLFLTESEHGVGLSASTANLAMSLGQVGEVAMMLLLAPSLRRLGTRDHHFLGHPRVACPVLRLRYWATRVVGDRGAELARNLLLLLLRRWDDRRRTVEPEGHTSECTRPDSLRDQRRWNARGSLRHRTGSRLICTVIRRARLDDDLSCPNRDHACRCTGILEAVL